MHNSANCLDDNSLLMLKALDTIICGLKKNFVDAILRCLFELVDMTAPVPSKGQLYKYF